MPHDIAHSIAPVDTGALSRSVTSGYHNVSVASLNDHEVRLSVMTAAFGWHRHPASDETFFCLEGALIIELEDRFVELRPGQLVTIPAGVLHRTRPGGARSVNLTIERRNSATVFEDREE